MKHSLYHFSGGIKPESNKKTSGANFEPKVFIPKKLILPVIQGRSNSVEIRVKSGDYVYKGQLLVFPQASDAVAVHASSSGWVSAIMNWPSTHPSGIDELSIIIDTDGQDLLLPALLNAPPVPSSSSEFLDLLHSSGVVGFGGAGFPTSQKLISSKNSAIKTLIVNGAECEPYISSDDALMRFFPQEISDGISILNTYLRISQVIVAIEDNKPEALSILQKFLIGDNIKVVKVPTIYPTGGEKQLIKLLLNIEIGRHALPHEFGTLCLNVGTLSALAKLIHRGLPCLSRVVTVCGNKVLAEHNREVLIGTPIDELLGELDISTSEETIIGGPLMGFRLRDKRSPLLKTSNCIIVGNNLTNKDNLEQACIRCGNCSDVCPIYLLPQQIYHYAKNSELNRVKKFNVEDCIECGCCDYVCPSNIPLVQYIRFSKKGIFELEQKNRKAESSKMRFQAKQARLEYIEQERKMKRINNKKCSEHSNKLINGSQSSSKEVLQNVLSRKGLSEPN